MYAFGDELQWSTDTASPGYICMAWHKNCVKSPNEINSWSSSTWYIVGYCVLIDRIERSGHVCSGATNNQIHPGQHGPLRRIDEATDATEHADALLSRVMSSKSMQIGVWGRIRMPVCVHNDSDHDMPERKFWNCLLNPNHTRALEVVTLWDDRRYTNTPYTPLAATQYPGAWGMETLYKCISMLALWDEKCRWRI